MSTASPWDIYWSCWKQYWVMVKHARKDMNRRMEMDVRSHDDSDAIETLVAVKRTKVKEQSRAATREPGEHYPIY